MMIISLADDQHIIIIIIIIVVVVFIIIIIKNLTESSLKQIQVNEKKNLLG